MKHFVVGISTNIDGKETKRYIKEVGVTKAEPINQLGRSSGKWFLKFNDISTTTDINEAWVFNENKRDVIDFGHLERIYTLSTSFFEEVVISPNKPVSEPLATSEEESREFTFYVNHHTELTSSITEDKIAVNMGRVDIISRVKEDGKEFTKLTFSGGTYVLVEETYAEIKELMRTL